MLFRMLWNLGGGVEGWRVKGGGGGGGGLVIMKPIVPDF